jgi:hypothetical protein
MASIKPVYWPPDEQWPPFSAIERVVKTKEGTLYILEDGTQIMGTDSEVGEVAFRDREHMETTIPPRLVYEYNPPARRTPIEKFRIQGQKAVNTLVTSRLTSGEAADRFFAGFLVPLSQECGTMNGAAFSFVMVCYDWNRQRFVWKKREDAPVISWEELVRLVDDKAYRKNRLGERCEPVDDLIREHGITARDLVRYLAFAEKRLG